MAKKKKRKLRPAGVWPFSIYNPSAEWTPVELFSGGQDGFWYDPSDLTTMFQDRGSSTASAAAAAVDSVVGLMLDKSQDMTLGSEVIVNGDFSSATGWSLDPELSITGGQLVAVTTATRDAIQTFTLDDNSIYRIDIDVASRSAGSIQFLGRGGFMQGPTTAGTFTYYFITASSGTTITIRFSGATTITLNSISWKKVAGNHAYQDTAAAKPILRNSGDLYWLEFDNTDDYLEINSYRPTPSGVLCFSMGLTCTDTLGMFFSEGAIGGDWFYLFNSGSSNTVISDEATINGVWKNGSAATPITTRGNLYTHVIGANSLSAKITVAAGYGTSAFRFSGYGGILAAGNYYGWVVSTDDWTADERTEVDAYMRAKKGV